MPRAVITFHDIMAPLSLDVMSQFVFTPALHGQYMTEERIGIGAV